MIQLHSTKPVPASYLLMASTDPGIGMSDEPESYRTPYTSSKNPSTPLAIQLAALAWLDMLILFDNAVLINTDLSVNIMFKG